MRSIRKEYGRKSIEAFGDIPNLKGVDIEPLVKELKAGSMEARDRLILGHLGYSIAMAAAFAMIVPSKAEELVGLSALTLTEVMENVRTGKVMQDHDNLVGYLNLTLRGRLQNFLIEDGIVIRPRISYAPEEPREPLQFVELPDILVDGISIEVKSVFEEIASSKLLTSRDKFIIQKKAEGYTEDEISKMLGYSRMRITQIANEVYGKIRRIFGDWK